MTEALASRAAGLKLGGIVAVLLLPMLVLSYFMIAASRQDIEFAEREMAGIELNRLIMPVALAAASRTLEASDVNKLGQDAAPLAETLGVQTQFSNALASLVTYSDDPRHAVDALTTLLHDSATASNIILDPYAETYYLGTIATQHGPALLADFMQVWTLQRHSLLDGSVSQSEVVSLLLATGAWQESQQRVEEGLNAARSASDFPKSYAAPLAVLEEMTEHPRHVSSVLSKAGPEMMAGLRDVEEFSTSVSHIIADVQELWSFSRARFEALLEDRLAAMHLQLYIFLGIAAAACLIGVGGAGIMFRSTLKQLDDVKLMRDKAEDAHAVAEQSAEDVRRINEDMARLNGELARNLAMLREAQDENLRKGKMAQLGQLTATVAHELRNPLGAVRTSAFLLARKVKDKGLGIEPQIERINNGITRCDNIISQLLDFARSKAIQPEKVDFDDWLAKLVEEEASRLPVSLSIECHLGIGGMASIDPARMSRAIINLLSNAAEALVGKGDEAAKPANPNPNITVSSRISARGYEVTVADNGPGIAPEHLAKIFEPLFTTKNFGTGLGLPAVQKIMEQHGGDVEVVSSPRQGAAFTLWWPLNEPGQAAA